MPARDRLAELQSNQKVKWTAQTDAQVAISRQDSTDKFLSKVENISESTDMLASKMEVLREIQQRILNRLSSDPAVDHEDQERILSDIILISTNIRTSLKGLDMDIQKGEKKSSSGASARIRRVQHRALSRRLLNLTNQYNKDHVEHRQRLMDRMRRQLKIADIDSRPRTDAEIEQLLESTNPMIFSQQIIVNSQKAKDALADVEARHQDMLALEKNVMEVRDLFWEVAALVEQQGEGIDRIENNMDAAVAETGSGRKEIELAVANQKRARRCKIIGILILVVVLVGVGIYLAVKFG